MPTTRFPSYDKTSKARQAKRRALFTQMRDALRRIGQATSLDEAKAIARAGLDETDLKRAATVAELTRF